MRFLLPLLVAKVVYDQLNIIYANSYNHIPSFSKTWLLQLVPDTWLNFGPESEIFYILIVLSLIGATFGIAGRLSLLLLAGLEFLIGGSFESLGIFDHNSSLSSQVLFILALVPGSMRISVDYFIYRKFVKPDKASDGPVPKWGLNLILIVLVLTYFTAGVSKIRHGGLEWLDGKTLSFYLENYVADFPGAEQQLLIANQEGNSEGLWKDSLGLEAHTYGNYQGKPRYKQLANWLVEHPFWVAVIAIITILFEFAWFTVFINSRFRNAYLILAIITHTSIGILMGLYFLHYRIICLCLLDWKQILNAIGGKYPRKIAAQIQSP